MTNRLGNRTSRAADIATSRGMRLNAPGVSRGAAIRIVVNGAVVDAFEGESVASVLLAIGRRALRTTALAARPRGLYCGMGVCHDCLVVVEGRPNTRACITPARDGMVIETQSGWASIVPAPVTLR